MSGSHRKTSSNVDVGGPNAIPVHTPPLQVSPAAATGSQSFEFGANNSLKAPPQFELNFSIFDAFFMVYGMVTYVADIVTDLLVGLRYLYEKEFTWAALTFAFVILTSLTLQMFSLQWFIQDVNQEKFHEGKGFLDKVLSWAQWLLFHIFQLGAVKRYWRTLKYGWRSRNKQDDRNVRLRNYRTMVYEYRDITMLRLLEAFMESGPQLVLQLYIIKRLDDQNQDIHWITGISALASLASLSWGLEAYHMALRESLPKKRNITYIGVFFRMVWRTFMISSRVLSMALFATEYQWIIFPIVGIHWILMTIWLVMQDTEFCTTQFEEMLFNVVIGFVYIFSFFNMKEGPSRYRAAAFYTIVFVENTVMFALWYHYNGRPHMKWYTIPALMLVWGGFALGLFALALYYCVMHPNIDHPCRRKEDNGRKLPPWGSSQGEDEVDRHSPHLGILFSRRGRRDLHLGILFSRRGRRDLQGYPMLLVETRNSDDQLNHRVPPHSECNGSHHTSQVPTRSPSNLSEHEDKTWVESQV